MLLSLIDLLLSVGVVQGLLSGFILLFSKSKQLSMNILGVIILVCSLVNLKYLMHVCGVFQSDIYVFSHTNSVLVLWPLTYLYIYSLIQSDFKFKKIYLVHLSLSLLYLSYDLLSYTELMGYNFFSSKIYLLQIVVFFKITSIESMLTIFSCALYIYFTYRKLTEFNLEKAVFSFTTNHVVCHWIRGIIICITFLTILYTYNLLQQTFADHASSNLDGWEIFHVIIMLFVYYHGFVGIRQADSDLYRSIVSMQSKDKKLKAVDVDRIKMKLLRKLENEEVYLNPTLSISELAEELEISSESLSFVVNHEFGVSFRDFINYYRVEAVKLELLNNKSNQKTILTISLDSGFNSQASFYRAFKKFEGLTPKKYMANVK